jgi:hypothetical protein
MKKTIVFCIGSFLVGILVGAKGYYTYANFMYRKHPAFFRRVLEHKLQKEANHDE